MKVAINVLLVALILFLIYMLYASIREPIAFQKEKSTRQSVVVERLQDIRKAQEIFRDITGEFAADFDTLSYVLSNDSIPFENIIGDPDDPTNMDLVVRTVTYTAASDSIRALGIDLELMRYVPFTDKATQFSMDADTLTYQQSLVSVVEVFTRWKEFMGPFGDPKYAKYDSRFDPDSRVKFGDMTKPNLTGNWE